MMIQRSKTEIFEGKGSKLLKSAGNGSLAALDLAEQALKPFTIHGCPFSGLATRSMRSLTALRHDFPSKSTALTSRTIGISTPCRSANPAAARLVRTPSATACIPARTASNVSPWPSRTPT